MKELIIILNLICCISITVILAAIAIMILSFMCHVIIEFIDEWRYDFCDWIKALPYSDFITGKADATNLYREAFRSCFEPTDEPIARAILTGEQMPEAKVIYKDAISKE